MYNFMKQDMDGANRCLKMWRNVITLSAIRSTIVIMLDFEVTDLNTGYEQIYLMQNSMNRAASDVLTYIFLHKRCCEWKLFAGQTSENIKCFKLL